MGFLDKILEPVGDILGFGGGEGGYPTRVEPPAPSPDETFLRHLLMQLFENPDMNPTTVIQNYIADLDRAEQLYEEMPGAMRTGLEPISGEHRAELADISRTPGIALSFGGKPVMTTGGTQAEMRPLRTMGTLKELAESRYQSALQAKMAELGQLEALPGRIASLAEGKRTATIDPMTDLFKTLFQGRMGTPVATPEYQPTFLEQLLPIAGQIGAGYATGLAKKA